jgi:hypothetical protein
MKLLRIARIVSLTKANGRRRHHPARDKCLDAVASIDCPGVAIALKGIDEQPPSLHRLHSTQRPLQNCARLPRRYRHEPRAGSSRNSRSFRRPESGRRPMRLLRHVEYQVRSHCLTCGCAEGRRAFAWVMAFPRTAAQEAAQLATPFALRLPLRHQWRCRLDSQGDGPSTPEDACSSLDTGIETLARIVEESGSFTSHNPPRSFQGPIEWLARHGLAAGRSHRKAAPQSPLFAPSPAR